MTIIKPIIAKDSAWTYRKAKHAPIAYMLGNALLYLGRSRRIFIAVLNLSDLWKRIKAVIPCAGNATLAYAGHA